MSFIKQRFEEELDLISYLVDLNLKELQEIAEFTIEGEEGDTEDDIADLMRDELKRERGKRLWKNLKLVYGSLIGFELKPYQEEEESSKVSYIYDHSDGDSYLIQFYFGSNNEYPHWIHISQFKD